MGWFKHKPDPIDERTQALNERIAALEAQIQRLNAQAAAPAGAPAETAPALSPPPTAPPCPIFEKIDQELLKSPAAATTPDHYNELGVRKYDPLAIVRRWLNHFRGPVTTNPKLVNYLAAGSIQGLRPLRYEKRVARNRFILLVICLVLVLWGLLAVYLNLH